MNKRKTFTALSILLAVLILGVGYATITDVEINLAGTANVKANADFSVEFDTAHDVVVTPKDTQIDWVSDENNAADTDVVTGSYTNASNAKMIVYLDSANREATAIYKIVNKSDELKATVAAEISEDFATEHAKYLTVSQALYSDEECNSALAADTQIDPNGVVYLKVTVSLDTLPIEDITNAAFNVLITGSPVEVEL